MAVTSQTFGQASLHMGLGKFNFTGSGLKVLLTSPSYTPNIDTHDFRNDVTNEITATGYTPLALSGVTWTYDAANNRSVLKADPITWPTFAATVRFAVIYGNVGAPSTDPLLAYIDLGEDLDLTTQGLSLAFPSTGFLYAQLSA